MPHSLRRQLRRAGLRLVEEVLLMQARAWLTDVSRGDSLRFFWLMYRLRSRAPRPFRSVFTWLMCRSAHRHGGYVGPGAVFEGKPSLPHGLHGVFISRYARIGAGCRIYQNVTIGEVSGKAPVIGEGCLIGAGAVIVGGVTVGDGARIGAGAVVRRNLSPGCTAVAPEAVMLHKGGEDL